METDSSNSNNISYLSLLMAPEENTTIEDHHHLLSLPSSSSSDFYTHWQNPCNLVSSPSFFDVHNFYHHSSNSKHHLQSSIMPPVVSSMPPSYSDYYVDDNPPLLHYDSTNTHFLPPLPNLLSIENSIIKTPSNAAAYYPPPPQNDDYTLGSILANYLNSKSATSTSTPTPTHSHKNKQPQKQHRLRNQRQKKISEKVYNLGKLLPGGHRHRKSTADMLKEAHKYIKFLQSQVRVLKVMPVKSQLTHELSPSNSISNGGSESLERLSRQQLLQVVVNSSAAQVLMADNGCCLFSAEQVALINKIQARQKIAHQLLSNLPPL